MNVQEIYKETFNLSKNDLLYLVEKLMEENKIDITDITICHTKALKNKLSKKDELILEADNCIFNSVFTDSLGKPSDNEAIQKKLEWLEKVGTHNMEGIFKYLKEHK